MTFESFIIDISYMTNMLYQQLDIGIGFVK